MKPSEILAILEEYVVGDGQGSPDNRERCAAVDAIVALMRQRGLPVLDDPDWEEPT